MRIIIIFSQDERGKLSVHVRPGKKKYPIRATKHVHASGNHLDLECTHTGTLCELPLGSQDERVQVIFQVRPGETKICARSSGSSGTTQCSVVKRNRWGLNYGKSLIFRLRSGFSGPTPRSMRVERTRRA